MEERRPDEAPIDDPLMKEDSKLKKERSIVFSFNSPVVLVLTIVSLAVVLLNLIPALDMPELLGARRTTFSDPMQYIRMFTSAFVHTGMAQYAGFFMLILAIGPMVEEKYGSLRLVILIVITSFVTGVISILFFPGADTVGASGIIFMLILMASFTNLKLKKFPLTVLLVIILYLGNEIMNDLFKAENVSNVSYIIGGAAGAAFGMLVFAKKMKTD